ncbi:DUF5624 domain-containing protein [Streptomyces sp. NPDC093252]|uniref:DUF5624 domain-containing protein n=1 Tax=Streptomyces sp. NPDC093252 TaxID=3154980 RepID=UPI003443283E
MERNELLRTDIREFPGAFPENAELVELFRAYTNPRVPGRDSTGDHLTQAAYDRILDSPLIVATASDLALYPGSGRRPSTQHFRLNVPGFKELAGVSHLAPALASVVRLGELGLEREWRADAERLLARCVAARDSHSLEFWRDELKAESFAGREEEIAAMMDYGLAVSIRYLRRALDEPGYLSARTLRDDYLIGVGQPELPVPFTKVVIATFSLVGLDSVSTIIRWVTSFDLDWSRTYVMIAGRQGRPTSGITKGTNSMARIIHFAARGALPSAHLLIAPHAPTFLTPRTSDDLDEVIRLEDPLRWMLARVVAGIELAPLMYEGWPSYEEAPMFGPDLEPGTRTLSDLPRIPAPDAWDAMYARLRLSLEDPRQLLASGVSDYVAEQLATRPDGDFVVPGLDNETYPPLGSTPDTP